MENPTNPLSQYYTQWMADPDNDFEIPDIKGVGILSVIREHNDKPESIIPKISNLSWVLAALLDENNGGINGDYIYLLINKDKGALPYYTGEERRLLKANNVSTYPVSQFDVPMFTSVIYYNDKTIGTVPLNPRTLKGTNIELKPAIDLDKYRVTKEKEIQIRDPVITIGGAKVAVARDITSITAEAKGGKTAIAGVFLAGAMATTENIDGLNDVWVKPNPEGKADVHIDTEQSDDDLQYFIKTSMKRAHIDKTPSNLFSYGIRTFDFSKYKDFTQQVCEEAALQCGGIHLIIIDGIAEYVTSVNDDIQAKDIIQFFTLLAETYDCPVITVVHLNENAGRNMDTTGRGHLGKHLLRKGYAQLNITKKGDISTLHVLRGRKAGETPTVSYRYDKEKGYHVSVDPSEVEESKGDKKKLVTLLKTQKAVEKILAPPKSLRMEELRDQLISIRTIKRTQAGEDIGLMVAHDMILKGDDGHYRLNPNRDVNKFIQK